MNYYARTIFGSIVWIGEDNEVKVDKEHYDYVPIKGRKDIVAVMSFDENDGCYGWVSIDNVPTRLRP